LFSGCTEKKSVRIGDNISIDYIGSFPDGTVFDTSIESVAKENNIIKPEYKPLKFTVGNGNVIKGLEEGVIGMKVGQTKNLTITPDKAYGLINPRLIQTIPIIEKKPATLEIPKVFNISLVQFERTFGTGHKTGDSVRYPGTNINLTIQNITNSVSLSYDLPVGYEIHSEGAPWNQTVIKIDDKNITLKHNAIKNSTVQLFPDAPWNTTVIDMNDENITLKHNAIPDTQIRTLFGPIRIHFNDTSIILDRNPELAGKTLIFKVMLRSID